MFNQALSKQLGSGILLHASANPLKHDFNGDGFLDHTINQNFIGINRWKFAGDDGFRIQLGVEGVISSHVGGQSIFEPLTDEGSTNIWGMGLDLKRVQGWAKFGKVYEDRPWKSVGLQLSASNDNQKSYFGTNRYDARESTLYANLIYQSIFKTTDHNIRIGASAFDDKYDEVLNDTSFTR